MKQNMRSQLQENLKACVASHDEKGISELLQVINDYELENSTSPDWAFNWGRSETGPWVEIEIGNIILRLLWIQAGMFVMGSPHNEPGRRFDEIQHRVIISEGFWLAETPVTQELWESVMGKDNSGHHPHRPACISEWADTQNFFNTLERTQPALQLRLPTEAQWEYACRGGTTTATYAGPMEISRKYHAPILHSIAWYYGNLGDERESQIQTDDAFSLDMGLRTVKTRKANPWGLYDMLGNINEFCLDGYRAYKYRSATYALIDPIGPMEEPYRVRRGGCWMSEAQYVRAASRVDQGLCGFRLSRSQYHRTA